MKPKVCDECDFEVRKTINPIKDEMLSEEGAVYISGWEDACDKIRKRLLGEK